MRDKDKVLSQDPSKVLRLNSKPLSRTVSAQDDWLRINFSLFKLGDLLYQRFYELPKVAKESIGEPTGYLCHLFDLYKI